jgi:hypothetical protein
LVLRFISCHDYIGEILMEIIMVMTQKTNPRFLV